MFERLLQELSAYLKTSLQPDTHNTCLISFGNKLKVHVELDREETVILLGMHLGSVAPGSYREQLLALALRLNSTYGEHPGIFAYNQKDASLILFDQFPVATPMEKIHEAILALVSQAKPFQEAIENNEIPNLTPSLGSSASNFSILGPR